MERDSKIGTATGNNTGTQAIGRALDVLRCFSLQTPRWSATELSDRLGLTFPTTKRIVNALVSEGVLTRSEKTGAYELGLRAYELGLVASAGMPLLLHTNDVLTELHEETGAAVLLFMVDGDEILFIKKIDSSDVFGFTLREGVRRPILVGCTLGNAILSTYPPPIIEAYLSQGRIRQTGKTSMPPKVHLKQLAAAKEQGFIIDREGYIPGLCGVAAPICQAGQTAVGGIQIVFPTIRFDEEKVLAWGQLVRQAALTIASRLLYAR